MNDAKARPMPRPEDEPTMAQLLDPLAWERRLQEARARRAEALANREGKGAGKGNRRPFRPERGGPPPMSAGLPGPASAGLPGHAAADRPAITGDMRIRPATGPAIATPGGPSIRDLVAQDEAAAAPARPPADADAFSFDSLPDAFSPEPPGRDRIAELSSILRPAPPASSAAEPSHPPGPATEADSAQSRHWSPAARSAPASGFATGRTMAAHDAVQDDTAHGIWAEEPAAGAAFPPRSPTVPSRPASRRRAGWSGARIAAVFSAGLGLGLAGAFAISGPVIERIQAVLPAGGEAPAQQAVAEAPAASGAPDTTPETGSEDIGEETAVALESAAPEAGDADSPATEPLATAEPAPAPAVSGSAGPALLPLPTMIPGPDAPRASGLAAAPHLPGALDAPGLPATPDPEAVAGAAPPGSLGLARPLGRPDDLPATDATEEPVDFAALVPEVSPPDAGTAAGEGALAEAAATAGSTPGDSPAAAQENPMPAATEGGAATAPEEPVPAATTGVPSRVLVHVPTALPGPTAEAVIGAIRGAGYDTAQRIDISFPIGSTNIRYYYPEDRAAAEAMAAAIRAETGQEAVARDFTGFRPQPSAGTVEIFLAGQPRATSRAQPAQQAEPAPAPPPSPAATAYAPPVGPAPVEVRRLPGPPAEQRPAPDAMRDLERLADEIGRAIARTLRN